MFFNNFLQFLWKYEIFKALFGDDHKELLLHENRELRSRVDDLESEIYNFPDTDYSDYAPYDNSDYYDDPDDFDSYDPLADDPDTTFDDFDDFDDY